MFWFLKHRLIFYHRKRKTTIDEPKPDKSVSGGKLKPRKRKDSDNKIKKKFELLMNNGGCLEQEMRVMDSKLRKINRGCKKKKLIIKSILKV